MILETADDRRRRIKKLYDSAQWDKLRKYQLMQRPLCQLCSDKGLVQEAHHVHHLEQHHGDPVKFFFGNIISVCDRCHDTTIRQQERGRYKCSTEINANGEPVDPNHPWWKQK
jgi:hypothetical protein